MRYFFRSLRICCIEVSWVLTERFNARKAPFTWERNRSIPSSVQFLERKNGLFTRERNDCVLVFVSVHTGTLSFRSTVFSAVQNHWSLPFFLAATTSSHAPRAKILSFHFLDQSCTSLNATERLPITPLFVSLFYRCTFWQ